MFITCIIIACSSLQAFIQKSSRGASFDHGGWVPLVPPPPLIKPLCWCLGFGRLALQAVFYMFLWQFDLFVSAWQVHSSGTIAISHLRYFNKDKAMHSQTYTKHQQQCANTELATGTYNWQSQELLCVLHHYVLQVKTILDDFNLVVSTPTAKPNLIPRYIFRP